MSEFSMTCACGDELKVDAESRAEAIEKLQAMMDEEGIQSHMEERHPGEPVPSMKAIHEQISSQVQLSEA